MKEKAFIVAVIPGEAKPCTQSRTARSKRRVEPSTISCAIHANNTPESTAAARLTSTATSRNTLALGADSGPVSWISSAITGQSILVIARVIILGPQIEQIAYGTHEPQRSDTPDIK